VPGLARHLKVTRQAVGWFRPAKPETVRYGEFPIFLVERGRGLVYGFPDFEGRGVKAAQHDHGPEVGPDEWGPPATDEELKTVSATLTELLPGAAGPILERDICLYTNTLKADMRADDGNEFIIDRLPEDPRIIIASPCSGHGAKFASAIGAMVADLALDPQRTPPDALTPSSLPTRPHPTTTTCTAVVSSVASARSGPPMLSAVPSRHRCRREIRLMGVRGFVKRVGRSTEETDREKLRDFCSGLGLTPIVELGVAEAYTLLTEVFHVTGLPPLEAIDYAQPNVAITGGFSQCVKIAGMAAAFNVSIANGGAWGFHNMHLQAGISNGTLVEHHYLAVELYKQIYRGLPEPVDGYFTMRETPGLGFEPDRDAIREIAKLPLSQGRGKG
jgi:hypothetical protein